MPRQNQVGQILGQAYSNAAQMRARAGQIEAEGMRSFGRGLQGAAGTIGNAITQGKEISDKASAIRKAIGSDKSGVLSEVTGITPDNMADLSDREIIAGMETVKMASEIGALQMQKLERQRAAMQLEEARRFQGRATRLNRSIDEARSMVEQADQGAQIFREDRLREAQQLLKTPAAQLRMRGGAVTGDMLREDPMTLLRPQPERLTPGQTIEGLPEGIIGVATNENNVTVTRDPTYQSPPETNPYERPNVVVDPETDTPFYQGAPGKPFRPVPRDDGPRTRAEALEAMDGFTRNDYNTARERVAQIRAELATPRSGGIFRKGTDKEQLQRELQTLLAKIDQIERDYGLRGASGGGGGRAPAPAPPPPAPTGGGGGGNTGAAAGGRDTTIGGMNFQ